jgi:general stress protein 26
MPDKEAFMIDNTDDTLKLAKLIRDIPYAMLTTVTEEGKLHSRPMATQQVDFDGDLWFFTDDSSPKVFELYQNRHVNVTYVDADSHKYVAVCGTGEIVKDRAKIDELWSAPLKAWFHNGKNDPHLALIKVSVDSAEYWEGPAAPQRFLKIAKALLGKSEETPSGRNERLELKPTG